MFRDQFIIFVIFQYLLLLTSQSSIIIVEDKSAGGCQPCYRKLFAGKRLAEIHIRKAIDCEQIEECSRECDSEKGFPCEGFNYRHAGARGPPTRGRGRGVCELTSMPPSQIDVVKDILQEPRYDYYERDLGCQANNKRPSRPPLPVESGWLNVRPPPPRPQENIGPYLPGPQEIPRPGLFPDRNIPGIEIPRPFGPDYPPKRRYQGENHPPGLWRPENGYRRGVPGLSIRPIEDEVRISFFRPSGPPPMDRRPDYWARPQPQDFAMNEIEPYRPGRRKDSAHGWGSGSGYGGVYGGSYGYNTNYIDGYDPPKRGGQGSPPKRPFGTGDHGYGEVYSYGGAFGYGDSQGPGDKNHFGGPGPKDECSIRSGAGFKLRRGIVRKSYLTPTLDQCESLCAVEKDCLCMTFSYRYSLASNAPTDNCLLSEISYRDLDFYTDIEPDRDYDIYSMTGDPKLCGKGKPPGQRPPEECFWRVRSGCGVPPEVVRKAIVAQGLGDCEAECVEAQSFTCRSFVYRYGGVHSASQGSPNCYLSDWPSQEIDPLSLPEVDDAELYQRGSFGRGCEPYPFPPLNNHKYRPEPDDRPMKKDEVCYAEYQKPCRLAPQAVMLTIYVDSEYECRERCSEMRERDPVAPCMSFSYRISGAREEHNCFLSDVPRRDLRPGIDYVHGDGHLLFAWKEFEPQCDSGYSIGIYIDEDPNFQPNRPSPSVPGQKPPPYPSHFEPPYGNERPLKPHGNRYPTGPSDFGSPKPFGHGGYGANSGPINHGGYGSDFRPNDGGYDDPPRPIDPDRPDPSRPIYGGNGGGFDGGFYDTDGRFGHGYNSGNRYDLSHKLSGGSTFQHFTVNGRPCKRGTKCERNKVAGFWSCEPEGGEFGTWDYCCEPKHHCGYSQGYHYPWCYVGPYEDQWRPCSEKYYPYLPGPRPSRPSSDRYDVEEPYGEVPRPGMLGRHWPVAYLHREAPPNSTDSFAAADSRRNRELQNVSSKNMNASSDIVSRDEKKFRGNYVIRNSEVVENWASPERSIPEDKSDVSVNSQARSGKIERITRFSESRSRKASAITVGRNSSENGAKGQRGVDQILVFKDFIDTRDSGALETPGNKNSSISSNWRGTTFVRLPTISPNKTEAQKFDDYFEVVNVD